MSLNLKLNICLIIKQAIKSVIFLIVDKILVPWDVNSKNLLTVLKIKIKSECIDLKMQYRFVLKLLK